MTLDTFAETIFTLIREHLRARGVEPPAELTPGRIERPPDAALGDYAFPCFVLAKAMRRNPKQIAEELAQQLAGEVAGHDGLTGVEAAGPYLNFRVSTAAMAERTLPAVLSGDYFARNAAEQGEKVMVEYSQPNTHKAFHVGHMRNVALGDALVRLLEYNGHEVIAANYIGDIGTHIARCLWYYLYHRSEEPPQHMRGEWLGNLYTAAVQMIEGAPPGRRRQYEAEVSEVLQRLEADEPEMHRLWAETRRWSLHDFQEIYDWLGARFDVWFHESEMTAGRQIVEEGLQRGVFQRSQGAVGIDLEPYGLGFFLVLKADGTTLYSTKDLALARIKFERYGIVKSIYVVGAEQTLHFRQVFKTLELLGYEQARQCEHLPYALVMLPEGKMSSRAGNTIPFSQLRRELNDYIFGNYLDAHRGDWDEDELNETARRIAVAGIRYGMVKQDPSRQIVFNIDDWLVSEGDTGTYLCYAYTRICSVQRQVGRQADPAADLSLLGHETEKALLRELYDFNRVAAAAAGQLRPNMVANHLFQIAKEFSRTYAQCSVKNAETRELADARLVLFIATGEVLRRGLNLLGITPPERM